MSLTLSEQLTADVGKVTVDSGLFHTMIHGANGTYVQTENGLVPSYATAIYDLQQSATQSAIDAAASAAAALASLNTLLAQKGQANGIATLDAGGKIPVGQIPDAALISIQNAASQAAMLALTAQVGDWAVRTDTNQVFVLKTADPTILGNWQQMGVIGAESNALAVLNTTGHVVRTGAGTYATRAVTGTSNQVNVANGDGIAANPTLTLSSTLVLPGTLSTAGTIASSNATVSTNTTSGALTVVGGAGFGGAVWIGGLGNIAGALTVTGHTTFEGVTSTGATGTGKLVYDTSPTLTGVTVTGSAFNGTVGATTPSTGAFTTISASGQITSTLATGTAPFVVASTTNVANLNASTLSGATFAAPGPIGSTTASSALHTTIGASGIVSITNATAATTTTSGALQITGGGSVQGAWWVGGLMNVAGTAAFATDLAMGTSGMASGNPLLSIYGFRTAVSAKYGKLQVDTGGQFNVTAEQQLILAAAGANSILFKVNGSTVGGFDGGTNQFNLLPGTAGAPSFFFTTDTNKRNGLYYSATDIVGVSALGTAAMTWSSTTTTALGTFSVASNVGNNGSLSTTTGFSGTYASASVGTNITQFGDGGVVVPSAVTNSYVTFDARPSTAAAAFTLSALKGLQVRDNALGAGSAVTTQTGVDVTALALGSTIYGIRSQIASGTNKYNLFIDGTAQNSIAGISTFTNSTASTTATNGALIVGGGVGVAGAINAGGTIKTTANFASTGATPGPTASTASIDFNTGVARWISYGADVSTNGLFRILSARSDGTGQAVVLDTDASSNVTSARDWTISGALLNSGSGRFSGVTRFGSTTWASTIAGTGEIILGNTTTDSPGIHFYTAANTNIGIDNSNGTLRFTSNLDESGGTVVTTMTNAGAWTMSSNLVVSGTGTHTFAGTFSATDGTGGINLLRSGTTGIVRSVGAGISFRDNSNNSILDLAATTLVATFNSTTDSTTSTSGAVVVSGGVGIAKNLTVGGTAITLAEVSGAAYLLKGTNANGTGTLVIQAGGGSAGWGGTINLYSAAHATKPGDVVIGLGVTNASFRINTGGFDAGSDVFTVSRQTGSAVHSGNLTVSGSGTSSFAGIVTIAGGVGSTSFQVSPTAGGSAGLVVIAATPTANTANTSNVRGFYSKITTAASAFTLSNAYGYHVDSATIGATSAITTLYGIKIEDQTGAGTNYALFTGSGLVKIGDTTSATSTTAGALLLSGIALGGGHYYATGTLNLTNNTLASGTYTLDINGASGADRSVFRASINAVSNGFTITYTHSTTALKYSFLGGNLLVGTTTDITGSGGAVFAGTTDSGSPTTGAVQLAGGMGVAKNVYIAGKLVILSTGADGGLGSNINVGLSAGDQSMRIGNSRLLNYGDVMLSRNLTPVVGADTYQTSVTGPYAAMEFYYDGATNRGIKWIVSSSNSTAGVAFTPSAGMTLNSAADLIVVGRLISSVGSGTSSIGSATNSTTSLTGAFLIGNGGATTNVGIGGGNIFAGGTINATSTMSAGDNLTVNGTSASRYLIVNSNAGQIRGVLFESAGSIRWLIQSNATAEGGSNAGSDFAIDRYNDAGAGIGTAFSINRATALATFAGAISNTGDHTLTSGQIIISTAGKGLTIKTGSNAKAGSSTLVAGTIVVTNTSVTANSIIYLTVTAAGGVQGILSYTKINGTSFTINSSNVADVSTIGWMIVEQN